jgi:hypothetical protein
VENRFWNGNSRSVFVSLLVGTVALGLAHAAAKKMELPDVVGTVPASWTATQPTEMQARFRLAQYRLPRAAGDTASPEVIVFYFGPGGGGGVSANLDRWRGMFEGNMAGKGKVTTTSRTGLKITTLDLTGTYKERSSPMAPNYTPRPNYRMLAAAIETTRSGGQGPYWARMVGPAKSVAAQQGGWDALLKSLKPR